MATLQKLRNAGPLLLIFVGLALLAFIAGDALRMFQSPQGSQTVGSINGKEVSAADYQKMYEEYSNVTQFMRGGNPLSEAEQNQLKDEVWNRYIEIQVIGAEAEKLGLTVTDAEVLDVVTKGNHWLLRQTPFNNNGAFDVEILNGFLAQYEQSKDDAAFIQQMQPIYEYWKFTEKSIKESLLVEKYQALVANSFITNPIVAESNFNASNTTYDIEFKAFPYSAIADSTVKVENSDIKRIYEQDKENFKLTREERNFKYVSVKVTPSTADRAELRSELTAYGDSLKSENADYATIVRLSGSSVPYAILGWAKDAYPEEVQLRIDSIKENEVVGPIYSQSDDSYTVFKLLNKESVADSVLYRQLVITSDSEERTLHITDSLLKVLESPKANFKEIAAKYEQANNDSLWLTSAMYEKTAISNVDAEYVKSILNGKKGDYKVFAFDNTPNVRFIYQVIDTKNPETKYNAVVIKRKAEFSKETYDKAYNEFSEFVANCKTTEDIEKNAEKYGYRVMTSSRPIFNSAHNVANIAGTREAIRWIFSKAELNEVSPLYECGNNDNLLVVTVTDINEKGYRSMESESLRPILTNKATKEKKAEKILAQIKGKKFEELSNMPNVKSDVAKRITFDTPAYIGATSSNEPAICAAVTKLQPGEVSEPIKGEGAVYVVKLTAKNKKATTFNATVEQATLKMQAQNNVRVFMYDLTENAEIEDERYLLF